MVISSYDAMLLFRPPLGYIFPSKGQEKFPDSEAFYVSNLETHVHKLETPVANLET